MRILLITYITIFLNMNSLLAQKSFHDFTVTDINGNEISMSEFKGKKILVVNVASKCGYTPQYEGLQKLYETYGGDKFTIIGFPANNFLGQEPGTDKEIKSFCTNEYGVTFPMMSKISVKGKDQAPIYDWLTTAKLNGVADSKVKWNFQKFLISEDGQWLTYFSTRTEPMSDEVLEWLK